jgi:myo-inositol-1(or 4)-monophosphatase
MINKIINIAKEAGEVIRNGFGENLKIEFKTGENNLVTNIDKAAEKIILDFVKLEYPHHSIIAEESGTKFNSSDYTWVIDPLDGTTNFAHGLPIFAVSIGIQKKDETIAGVIYDVMNDKIYAAEKGAGTYVNGNKSTVTKNNNLAESLVVTGFPYDIKKDLDETVRVFTQFLLKTRGVRRLGSAAIDFCYVASGVFEGFWESGLNPWDVCAGLLLVKEAGGTTSDFMGEPINIFSNQFLATNGLVHKKMLEVFSH